MRSIVLGVETNPRYSEAILWAEGDSLPSLQEVMRAIANAVMFDLSRPIEERRAEIEELERILGMEVKW